MEEPEQSANLEATVIDKPEHNYALYAYHVALPISDPDAVLNGLSNDSLDLAADDVEERESKNYILSILSTDLTASEETELRSHMSKKMLKGGTESMTTSVCLQMMEEEAVVQPNPHGCYHRVFISKKEENKGFIVCFLVKQERGLELFQPDLDKYSQGLESKIDGKFSNLDTTIKTFLESWYNEIILYTGRCMQSFTTNLHHVLYAALMDMTVDMKNSSDQDQLDLQRFMACCSLKEMLTSDDSTLVHVSPSQSSSVLKIDFSSNPPTVEIRNDSGGAKTTVFCKDWAETLQQAATSSPFCLRQIIENYKLKVIQDMNHFRRLIKQSESDHYALFRTYAFLKCSGNVEIMLYLAKSQGQGQQTMQVLEVLDSYIASQPQHPDTACG